MLNTRRMNAGDNAVNQSLDAPAAIRVLVVDDDTTIFDVFQNLLPSPRYTIANAAAGAVALELASKQIFDVAFVDYYMSHMDGAEVSEKLRKMQPGVIVILVTGYLVHDRAAIMEQASAHAFLTKPFTAELVRGLIGRLLSNKERHTTVQDGAKKHLQ